MVDHVSRLVSVVQSNSFEGIFVNVKIFLCQYRMLYRCNWHNIVFRYDTFPH